MAFGLQKNRETLGGAGGGGEASTKPCSLERLLQEKQQSVSHYHEPSLDYHEYQLRRRVFLMTFQLGNEAKLNNPAEPPQTLWSSLGSALGLPCPIHTWGDSLPIPAANSSRTGRCARPAPTTVPAAAALCLL